MPSKKKATIILPHQLFKAHPALLHDAEVYLVEETLFFHQYKFHKQKILFHRASMKYYACKLRKQGYQVNYIEAHEDEADIRACITALYRDGVTELHMVDPTDDWLERRICSAAAVLDLVWYDNPSFINTRADLQPFFKATKKKFFQTSFYKEQRLKHHILVNDGQPVGGKWTYDVDNRKKYPRGKTPPKVNYPVKSMVYEEAMCYVKKQFAHHHGELNPKLVYPTTHQDAEDWLEDFFEVRFHSFGDYEDAIVREESVLHHSLLSPLLNVGLLLPMQVVQAAITYGRQHMVPLNSIEGFVRQIMGWREFIRGVYEAKGTEERNSNFWKHTRPIPPSFYDGTTGIPPIDDTIKKVLQTAYAHHIERLMVLGNFMLLCEFDPVHVYRWFMELFIDSYDWVMVPNVYGMSLFADGGLMSSKPYVSSSNYIKKMSNYPDGPWRQIWDGLYWRFMSEHRDYLATNPRQKMLINTLDRMPEEKRRQHFEHAERYLQSLGVAVANHG